MGKNQLVDGFGVDASVVDCALGSEGTELRGGEIIIRIAPFLYARDLLKLLNNFFGWGSNWLLMFIKKRMLQKMRIGYLPGGNITPYSGDNCLGG